VSKIDLPQKWTVRRLGDLASAIQYGYTAKAQQDKVGPKLLRITDIQNGAVNWDTVPFCSIDESDKAKYLLGSGDLVFARTGATVGKSFLITGSVPEAVFASYLIRVRLREGINPKYVSYFFKSSQYWQQISESQAGIGQPNVNGKKLSQLQIPVAPPDQQKLIVAEIEKQFSRLDEAVGNLKRVKANLKRYKATVLKAAVEGKLTAEWRKAHPDVQPASELLKRILTERRAKWNGKGKYKEPSAPDVENLPDVPERWSWCRTDQLLEFVTSGSRGWAKYYSDNGAVFLRVGNLDHDSLALDLSDIQRVRPPEGAEGTRTRVQDKDILISITADVGMVAVVPHDFEEAYINQHISLARPVNGFSVEYLAWYLAARSGQKQFLELQRGATKAGLGLEDIRSVSVPMPPLAEQMQIVSEIESRFSVVAAFDSQLSDGFKRVDRLRQSILKAGFSGHLNSSASANIARRLACRNVN
jgi:type I restriction enzyme S subunit